MFKLENSKDWKTTVISVVSFILMVAGYFWPDKIDPETKLVIESNINEIVVAGGALIQTLVLIFGAKDPK